MNLELNNNLNQDDQSVEAKSLIKEILEVIKKTKNKIELGEGKMENLYYVLDANPNEAYITRYGTKEVLKVELPQDIRNKVSEGFILELKEGEYVINEELTEKNFNGELNFK